MGLSWLRFLMHKFLKNERRAAMTESAFSSDLKLPILFLVSFVLIFYSKSWKFLLIRLSRVIDSTDSRVTNQSIWALSNLATDCFEFRHKILELTVVDSLMSFLAQNQDNSKYLQNLAWFLSNIFRPNSKQNVDHGLIRKFLPLLFK